MNTVRIGLGGFVFRLSCIVFSWSFFFWFEAISALLAVLPILLGLLFISVLLARGPLRTFGVHINAKQAQMGTLLVILLTIAAPFYARFYGAQITHHIITEVGIDAVKKSQMVSSWDDLGITPRYVRTVYQLEEPVESAIQKARQRLTVGSDWGEAVDYDNRLIFLCVPHINLGNSIKFGEDEQLIIELTYGNTEPRCLLRSSQLDFLGF